MLSIYDGSSDIPSVAMCVWAWAYINGCQPQIENRYIALNLLSFSANAKKQPPPRYIHLLYVLLYSIVYIYKMAREKKKCTLTREVIGKATWSRNIHSDGYYPYPRLRCKFSHSRAWHVCDCARSIDWCSLSGRVMLTFSNWQKTLQPTTTWNDSSRRFEVRLIECKNYEIEYNMYLCSITLNEQCSYLESASEKKKKIKNGKMNRRRIR